jgi:hypothetical protein
VASFDTAGHAIGVHVVGDYAYVADEAGGLVILRIFGLRNTIYLPIVVKNFSP